MHAHHAVQVFIPLSGSIRLRTGPAAKWRQYQGAIVPSNQSHEADAPVELLATLWLDPCMDEALRLVQPQTDTPILSVDRSKLNKVVPRLRECWNECYDSQQASALIDEVLEILEPQQQPVPVIDARVARSRKVLGSIRKKRAPLSEVARTVSLSPSRLTHLFSAELRMPPRRYLVWLRLLDAIQALALGASIAEAAQTAGFSDSPHLTRTFRRMLGFTPSAGLQMGFVPGTAPRRL